MQVHSLESMAALDGEGLRCAIFMSGCPLRCVYCHNPDTWQSGVGFTATPEELAGRLKRFLPYFRASGGGVTFSGGEPLLQAKELLRLAELLRAEGISYTLDTSGGVPLSEDVKRLTAEASLVICDLKFPDAESYLRYTGSDGGCSFSYLRYLSESGKRTWVRTVIVPGLNDSEVWIERYVGRLLSLIPAAEKYELLGFHTMGFFKYEESGLENPLRDCMPMSPERLRELQSYADELMKRGRVFG